MFCSLKRAKCTFFFKKIEEKFGNSEKSSTFALAFRGTLLGNRKNCGNSSVGRARPCQGRGREFESRFPLQGCSNGGIGRHEGLNIPWPLRLCGFKSRFEYEKNRNHPAKEWLRFLFYTINSNKSFKTKNENYTSDML